jgi:hypothetical protein
LGNNLGAILTLFQFAGGAVAVLGLVLFLIGQIPTKSGIHQIPHTLGLIFLWTGGGILVIALGADFLQLWNG